MLRQAQQGQGLFTSNLFLSQASFSFWILKACQIRMFYTSLESKSISKRDCSWGIDVGSIGIFTRRFFSYTRYHSRQRYFRIIFQDFQEYPDLQKSCQLLCWDLRPQEKLLSMSVDPKLQVEDTCWLIPLTFLFFSLLVPKSVVSSFFFLSCSSISSKILFSTSAPTKYKLRHTNFQIFSITFILPLQFSLAHQTLKTSQKGFSSQLQTMTFSPTQKQNYGQIPRICLKKSISLFFTISMLTPFVAGSFLIEMHFMIQSIGNSLEMYLKGWPQNFSWSYKVSTG